jgi:RNA polymerase sigma-70 factor (ECF subfamily)
VQQAWEHRPLLWGLAYRMTGTVQDADDVVQDTWVRMLERPPATDRPLRPWLVAVTLNLARDRLRARRRAGWTGPWLPEPVPDTRLADDRLAMRQTASWAFLCRAEALTPTQRAVFLAREVLELSSAETAETLRVSTNVVDVTLHRARSILGKLPESPRLADDAVVLAFLAALQVGAVPVARRLLASDVVCINDGGGVVNAARVPITGVERLLRFFVRIQRLYPEGVSWRAVRCNGLLLFVGHPRGVVGRKPPLSTLFAEVEGGKIVRFTSQLTPAKLQAVLSPS